VFPWLGVLAGTLATKTGSSAARRQAGADILRRNAQKLGGDTNMLDARMAENAIGDQEAKQLTGLFTQQLVNKLSAGDIAKEQTAKMDTQTKPGLALRGSGVDSETGLQLGESGGASTMPSLFGPSKLSDAGGGPGQADFDLSLNDLQKKYPLLPGESGMDWRKRVGL
jgi:hypothetical protein